MKVLYFASARDAAGLSQEVLKLSGRTTVSELLVVMTSKHPSLSTLAKSTRISVNRVLVDWDAILEDGDEVGVLPPVAGG